MTLEKGELHSQNNGLNTDFSPADRVGEILNPKEFISNIVSLDAPTDHVKLRAYRDSANHDHISEFPKNQDVVDVVAYVKKGEHNYLATMSNVRPGPLIHDLQDNGGNHIEHSDFIELPAGIIHADKGETELTSTAMRVAQEKLGAKDPKRIFHLGGIRTHSAGKTTELTYPIALELSHMPSLPMPDDKDRFQKWSKVEWRSLEDIVSGYFSGKIQDTRLITSVFDIAEKEKISFNLDLLDKGNVINHYGVPTGFKILDVGSVNKSHLQKIPLVYTEIDYKDIQDPFLSASKYDISTKGSKGVENNIQVDVSYRKKGNDVADCMAYILINNLPYLAVSFQDRPNLELRDQEYHPIYSEHSNELLHGISRVIDRGDSEEDIERKIIERIGGKGIRNFTKIGHDYPSAGHSAERVTRYIGEMTQESSGKETIIMSVDDILMLARRGEIIDSRLILSAHIIKNAFDHQTLLDFSDEDIEAYEKMVRSGSRVFAGLTANNEKLRNLHIHCLQFPQYRRRILYAEQELGAAQFDFQDENEKGFFDASIPVFANPQKVTPENAELYLLYLLHDFDHYRMGEFIPWYKDNAGSMKIHDKNIYQKMMAWTEAEAVFYSDVVTPNFIGIERFESIINPNNNPEIISLGRAFRDMGISMDEARQVLLEIERDGKIPDIVKNSERYPEFKDLFVGRMLRFHFLDYYQAGFEYDWWKSHEHVAGVMLRFGITSNNPDAFVRGFDESSEMLERYKEGFNPLRAELSRMINVDIRILALRIAFVKDCSRENNMIQSWADRHLDELEEIQSTLKALMIDVKNTSTSVVNLRAYKALSPFRLTLDKIANVIKQPGFTIELTDGEKEAFSRRIFPYFKPYESLDPNEEPLKSMLQKGKEDNA